MNQNEPEIVVIYGPQGSGKTVHAEQLRSFYRCARVLDGWCPPPRRNAGLRGRLDSGGVAIPQPGDLILTTAHPEEVSRLLPDARLISIEEAKAAIVADRRLTMPSPTNGPARVISVLSARTGFVFPANLDYSTFNSVISINRPCGAPLLKIMADGTVEARSLEDASEAGRVFVESIRKYLPGRSSAA